MPCRDWPEGPTHYVYEDTAATKAKVKTLEAMLCAVLTVLTKDQTLRHALRNADWKEAGVSQDDVSNWWVAHQEKDRARRRAEQAAEQKRQIKAAALAKLTPAERKALGI